MSLLERCPHFRGWYVQTLMDLGPEDVSLSERCPHFRGWYYHLGSGEWQKIEAVSGNPPSPRTLHSSTSMWRGKLVVFSGGDSGTDAVENTIHLFDIGEVREKENVEIWSLSPSLPPFFSPSLPSSLPSLPPSLPLSLTPLRIVKLAVSRSHWHPSLPQTRSHICCRKRHSLCPRWTGSWW